MCGIWYNPFDVEIPPHHMRPTRVIKKLSELLED
jgi:hypothetical protein